VEKVRTFGMIRATIRLFDAWFSLDSKLPYVNRSFQQVRNELCEIGLLDEGIYLDQVELCVAALPSTGEAGYVFEKLSFLPWLAGYQEGVIYLPRDLPSEDYVPGGTLTDTIRHEFAHAWHWLEPEFFEQEWFYEAFRGGYEEDYSTAYQEWSDRFSASRKVQEGFERLRTESTRERFLEKQLLLDFASDYAKTRPCEDFAETFMMFLRYRNSLNRFRNRPGLYRKLRAVQKAVRRARIELGL
jgi:hypothetical protein